MMVIQAGASLVVGSLVEYGFAFDRVYQGFSIVLLVIFLVLLGLYSTNRLPERTKS